MFCTQCGTRAANDQAAFCAQCGASLVRAGQPVPVGAATSAPATFAVQPEPLDVGTTAPDTVTQPGPPPPPQWLKDVALTGTEWGGVTHVAAMALLPVIVAVTVVAGCALSVLADAEDRGSFVDWIRVGVTFVCVAFGATLRISSTDDSGQVVMHGVPMLITAATVALCAWWSRRDEAARNSRGRAHLLARAAAAAAVGAVALLLLEAMFDLPGGFEKPTEAGAPTDVSVAPLLTGLVALMVLAVTGALARAALYGRQLGSGGLAVLVPQAARAEDGLDVARTWLVTMAALSVPGAVVAVAVLDPGGFWKTSLVVALGAGQLLAAVGVISMFGGLTGRVDGDFFGMGGRDEGSFTLFSDGVHWGWKFLLLVPVTAIAVTGVRFALRRAPHLDALRAWWVPAAAVTAASLAVGLLARVSFSASNGGGDEVDMDFSARTAVSAEAARLFLVALVCGVLVAVAARFLTPVVVGSFPGLARRIGGRRLHSGWGPHLGTGAAWPVLVPAQGGPIDPNGQVTPDAPLGSALPPVRTVTLRPRTKWLIALLGGIVVLAGAALVGGVQVAERTTYSPTKPVQTYLALLANGQVDAAARAGNTTVSLHDAVLANPVDRISHVQIGDVTKEGDTATVAVTYTLAGEKVQDSYQLERAGSALLGLVDRWKLTVKPDELHISVPAGALVKVNGVAASSVYGTRVLPGQYRIEGSSPVLSIDAETTTAADSDNGVNVVLDGAVNATGLQLVQDAVAARLRECAASQELEPAGCPFSYMAFRDIGDVRWSKLVVPSVTAELTDTGSIRFSSEADAGSVHLSGVEKDALFGDYKLDEDVTFTAEGSAELSGTSANIGFDDGF